MSLTLKSRNASYPPVPIRLGICRTAAWEKCSQFLLQLLSALTLLPVSSDLEETVSPVLTGHSGPNSLLGQLHVRVPTVIRGPQEMLMGSLCPRERGSASGTPREKRAHEGASEEAPLLPGCSSQVEHSFPLGGTVKWQS